MLQHYLMLLYATISMFVVLYIEGKYHSHIDGTTPCFWLVVIAIVYWLSTFILPYGDVIVNFYKSVL